MGLPLLKFIFSKCQPLNRESSSMIETIAITTSILDDWALFVIFVTEISDLFFGPDFTLHVYAVDDASSIPFYPDAVALLCSFVRVQTPCFVNLAMHRRGLHRAQCPGGCRSMPVTPVPIPAAVIESAVAKPTRSLASERRNVRMID
jgi:hypothetical protein